MFQDQFGVQPARGGRNYLNLSGFRDRASAFAWQASAWVRWYATFIEQWIQTSAAIGDFLDVKQKQTQMQTQTQTQTQTQMQMQTQTQMQTQKQMQTQMQKQMQKQQNGRGDADHYQDKFKGMMDEELAREVSSLGDLLLVACGWEAEQAVMEHRLVKEGVRLVTFVTLRAYEEIKLRLREVGLRARALHHPSQASAFLRVCDFLLDDSSSGSLACLFDMCDDPVLRQNRTVCREVPFSQRELLELRKSLSSQNIVPASNRRLAAPSIGPGFFFLGNEAALIPPLPSQSMRRSKLVVADGGCDFGRAASMSHLAYYETFL
jgi:cell division protein FtsB